MLASLRHRFSTYFSVFNHFTHQIPMMRALYILSIPLMHLLMRLKITPNQATTLSNFLALVGLFFLLLPVSPWIFAVFWSLALSCDMCDGMIARLTHQSTPNGAFYDHMTDHIKLLLFFLAISIKYPSIDIQILAFLSSTFFLFYAVLSEKSTTLELQLFSKFPELDTPTPSAAPTAPLSPLKKFKQWIMPCIFLIHGHTVFLLIPAAFGSYSTRITLLIFLVSVFVNSRYVLEKCIKLNRQLFSLPGTPSIL